MDEVERAMGLTPHGDRGKANIRLWEGNKVTLARVKCVTMGTWTAAYAIIRGVTSMMLHRPRTSIGPFAFDFGLYGLLTLSA